MHLVLEYVLADDYLERRTALRSDHLDLARAAHERGELLLAGALPDPYDRALLVWTAPREVVERFVAQDPYVTHGLVTAWTIRPWSVVVG
ncbi:MULTISPECIES: YciI-like protein [unclassified Blastococcus]